MGFLDTLRKLGILTIGTEKAVYTKAADRPDSFGDEDFSLSQKKADQKETVAQKQDKQQ